ncbi:MAG: phosphohistidine phosphatase SixA [Candidatus Pelagadaptatus aseana]|uniref:phosphohistidine phosphatase SixA n=1 Tax=Candidatus Pelagadaptatus aseana TaxID=3120508 RepID=UPI0039B223FB
MQLFVLRHGNAELYANTDAERNLTDRGMAETSTILQASLTDLSSVTSIYASPYVRAQQTAAIASELLDLPVTTCDLITPEGRIESVCQFLSSFAADEVPLLVSHQPFVGGFIDWLGDFEPGRYIMGTSALAQLSVSVLARGCADLVSLKQP